MTISVRRLASWMVTCALMLASGAALAHKGSDAYLDVREAVPPAGASVSAAQAAEYRFALSVALKDLDLVVSVDANADGQVTWAEVKTAAPDVARLLDQVVQLESSAAPCRLDWQPDGVERRSDGVYARMAATAVCPLNQSLALRYSLFNDTDAGHRLLVTGRLGNQDLLTTASPQNPNAIALRAGSLDQGGNFGRIGTVGDYFSLGMSHLLEGYDHLAFLLALVLPLQLRLLRRQTNPGTGRDETAVWMTLLRTITAFTIGHSITLMMAAVGWVRVSPAWIEPIIALSIAVAALLNLRPVVWLRADVLALAFGLVHGFGFAGLLLDAAAPPGLLPWALLGFNLGVEAGQLLAVAGWVVLSQMFVGRIWYQPVVVRFGSVLLSLVAVWWFWERVRDTAA